MTRPSPSLFRRTTFKNFLHTWPLFGRAASKNVEQAIAYFRDKLEAYEPDQIGSLPAEVLINLLVRVGKPGEAAQIARRHLRQSEGMRGASPSLAELCRQAGDYGAMIDAAREQGDPVHFLAGMLAQRKPKTPRI